MRGSRGGTRGGKGQVFFLLFLWLASTSRTKRKKKTLDGSPPPRPGPGPPRSPARHLDRGQVNSLAAQSGSREARKVLKGAWRRARRTRTSLFFLLFWFPILQKKKTLRDRASSKVLKPRISIPNQRARVPRVRRKPPRRWRTGERRREGSMRGRQAPQRKKGKKGKASSWL